MDNTNNTVQLSVYVTPEIKTDFNVLCIKNQTDMTKAINKYIALCLSENKLIV